MKPIKTALTRLQPIVSFKIIDEKIHMKIGAVKKQVAALDNDTNGREQ